MEPLNLYQIIDVVIKLTAGVFIVIYLNNRNNNVKKKEILYNLSLNLMETHHGILANIRNSTKYVLLNATYEYSRTTSNYTEEEIKFIKEYSQKYQKASEVLTDKIDEFERVVETIELILGKQTKTAKWKDIRKKAKRALIERYTYIEYNSATEEIYNVAGDSIGPYILEQIEFFHLNIITNDELIVNIENKIDLTINDFLIKKFQELKTVDKYTKQIFRSIEKL